MILSIDSAALSIDGVALSRDRMALSIDRAALSIDRAPTSLDRAALSRGSAVLSIDGAAMHARVDSAHTLKPISDDACNNSTNCDYPPSKVENEHTNRSEGSGESANNQHNRSASPKVEPESGTASLASPSRPIPSSPQEPGRWHAFAAVRAFAGRWR
jgi:hypothetical protein